MNVIAIFPTGITELTVNGLHQWDYGRKLEIHASDLPALVEVHFACPGMEEAIVRVGSAVGGVVTVAIPDRCLEQSAPITAWVYEVGETYGQTIKALTLNIMKRARPQVAETITPEICDKYTEAVGAVNEAMGALNGAVDDLKNGNITVAKAENSTKADHALVANHTKMWTIATLAGLEEIITINPASSIGLSIRNAESGITIPTETGKVLIPNWSYGTLTVDEIGDASMHLTSYTGEVFHLFYNNGDGGSWTKGSVNADRVILDKSNPNDVLFDNQVSGGFAQEVSVSEPGLYALYILDEMNHVHYSQVAYVYSIESGFSIPLKSGTHSGHLNFINKTAESAAHFYAVSTDLQYRFGIISVVKIAGIRDIQSI